MQVVDALSADEWELVTSDALVPLSCVGFEADFRGHIELERVDESLAVSRVTTSGIVVDRTARQASHANSDDIHLSFQLGAPGIVRQGGGVVRVAAGDVVSYATDRSYHLDYCAPGQSQLLLQVSPRALDIPLDVVGASCDRLRVTAPHAAETLLGVLTAARGTLDGAGEADAETVRDLAASMIRSSVAGTRVLPTTRGGMLATIRSYLERNMHEGGLDASRMAQAHFISRRFLYELFEPLGEAPAEYLRRRRLRRAAELLESGTERLTISQVAMRCGFGDPTTFARAFHREFGMSPHEYRDPAEITGSVPVSPTTKSL